MTEFISSDRGVASEGRTGAAFDDYAQRLSHLGRLSPEDMLEELLAVIHGDGGHYSDEHGLAKAVADAEVKWYAHGEAYDNALAACRDAFPLPPPGSRLDAAWRAAMADPLEVPGYVREAAGNWQPIATAPLEEMILLAGVMDYAEDWRIKVGYYSIDADCWRIFGASWKPLQWMRLPAPPHSAANTQVRDQRKRD